MRELQFVGLILSLLIGLYGILKYKSGRYGQVNFLITSAVASALFALSLAPALGDLLARPLQMDRWNAVLFGSTLCLFCLVLYLMNQTTSNRRTITALVEALARHRFWAEHAEIEDSEVAVVIPAYNEADNIAAVLRRIPQEILGCRVQTYVVVDGGWDSTEQIARQHAVPVLVQPINCGGGAALRAGYQVALDRGAEIIVTLDADGQHQPEEIAALVQPILEGRADFVNGSRVLGSGESESHIRSIGIVFFNALISLLMMRRITDSSNAFRAIRADVLRQLTLRQDQFHTSEILIEALKKGSRVMEVPITILRRQSGTTRKPGSLRYGWGFTKAIFSTWLR